MNYLLDTNILTRLAEPGHAMRTVALRVHATDGEVTAIELAESAQHIEQAGLAGTVGANQAMDLAAADREVDSVGWAWLGVNGEGMGHAIRSKTICEHLVAADPEMISK